VTTVQVDTEIEEIGEGLEEDETVGFNPQLLGKAVGNFFENNPLFHYIDKTMPAVLTDDTDESLALIMPVKLPGE
jgi:DNA polymerase III sliding clamp (beta) subunit (PCNA family)